MTVSFESFGRTVLPTKRVIGGREAVEILKRGAGNGLQLPVGNGRSYGDTCQNTAGAVIDMREFRRFCTFDPDTGTIEAEAGVLLSSIIKAYAPRGYFLPVVPGTRWVTLGGAIANDIHGKNHHRRGSFGCHVERLTLLRTDGEVFECSRAKNAKLFAATIGGMGLTGIILRAAIRLMPAGAVDVEERVTGFDRLERYFEIADAADAANEYAVAWIDQLATGPQRGRGVLLTANHLNGEPPQTAESRPRLSVPFQPPFTVLSKPGIRAFNMAYRWSQLCKRGPRRTRWDSFFFPLDAVGEWNRLYGPRGLYQHQSVLPVAVAEKAVGKLIDTSQQFGQASFLTVLKRFGDKRSPAILSFARQGYTLTLDFPNRGSSTLAMLDALDRVVMDAGGAVNPYKDARMSPDVFAASFPQWEELEAMRDPGIMSDFWARTARKLQGMGGFAAAAE
jgi:FAD/FMN-containing dehydrogenase